MSAHHAYGWVRDALDRRDLSYRYIPRFAHRFDLPERADMEPISPPIYNQWALGSCTGNAFARCYDICRKTQDLPFLNPSRLFAYYVARKIEGTVSTDAGAQIRDVVKGVARYGICSEADWPYIIGNFATLPSSEAFAAATRDRLISYQPIEQDIDHIRDALANQVPIICGITIYESFESGSVAANGMVPLPPGGDAPLGGHAITLIGYDHDRKLVKCANSWGTDWGNHGYFYLPYDYTLDPHLAADFWGIRLVTEDQPAH